MIDNPIIEERKPFLTKIDSMLRARSELCSSNNCLKKWTSCKRSDVFSDPSTSRLRGGPFLGFRRRMSVLHVASATRTTRKKKTLEQTPNRLINEQSPDLISYAHNLVRETLKRKSFVNCLFSSF